MVEITQERTLEDDLRDLIDRKKTLVSQIKRAENAKEELALNEKRMKEIMKKLLEV